MVGWRDGGGGGRSGVRVRISQDSEEARRRRKGDRGIVFVESVGRGCPQCGVHTPHPIQLSKFQIRFIVEDMVLFPHLESVTHVSNLLVVFDALVSVFKGGGFERRFATQQCVKNASR